MFHSFSLGKKDDSHDEDETMDSPKPYWQQQEKGSPQFREQMHGQTPNTPSHFTHAPPQQYNNYSSPHYQPSQFPHPTAPYHYQQQQPSTPSSAHRLPFSQGQSFSQGVPSSPFNQVPSSPFSQGNSSPFGKVPSSPFSSNQGPSFHDRQHQPTFSNAVHYEPRQARPSEFYQQQQQQHIRAPSTSQAQQPVLPSFNDFLSRMDAEEPMPRQPTSVATPYTKPSPMYPPQRQQEQYQVAYPIKEQAPQQIHHQQINNSGFAKINGNNGRIGFSYQQEQPMQNNFVQYQQHY